MLDFSLQLASLPSVLHLLRSAAGLLHLVHLCHLLKLEVMSAQIQWAACIKLLHILLFLHYCLPDPCPNPCHFSSAAVLLTYSPQKGSAQAQPHTNSPKITAQHNRPQLWAHLGWEYHRSDLIQMFVQHLNLLKKKSPWAYPVLLHTKTKSLMCTTLQDEHQWKIKAVF